MHGKLAGTFCLPRKTNTRDGLSCHHVMIYAAMVVNEAFTLSFSEATLDLPDEEQFWFTGEDWLLFLLDSCPECQRASILLLLWRAWFVHNNITHNSGHPSVEESVGFLLSYCDSIMQCRDINIEDR